MIAMNEWMSWDELARFIAAYKAIGGLTCLFKLRNFMGECVGFMPYHIGQMQPVTGENSWIANYRYDLGEGKPPIMYEPKDVIQLNWPAVDPLHPWRPLAPMIGVARQIDTESEMSAFLYSSLKNNSEIPYVASFPSDANVSEQEMKNVKAQLLSNHSGSERGKPAVVSGGMTIQRLGSTMKEMEMPSMRDIPETRIAAAFLMSPVFAGFKVGVQQSIYHNVQEAELQFYRDTLAGMWSADAAAIEHGLQSEFPGPFKVEPDFSEVPALREEDAKGNLTTVSLFEKGIITRDEARTELGYDPLPVGSGLTISTNGITNNAN